MYNFVHKSQGGNYSTSREDQGVPLDPLMSTFFKGLPSDGTEIAKRSIYYVQQEVICFNLTSPVRKWRQASMTSSYIKYLLPIFKTAELRELFGQIWNITQLHDVT